MGNGLRRCKRTAAAAHSFVLFTAFISLPISSFSQTASPTSAPAAAAAPAVEAAPAAPAAPAGAVANPRARSNRARRAQQQSSRAANLPGGEIIQAIEVVGNRKIEKDAILAKVQSAKGSPLNPVTVRADIQALHQLGYFDSVQVSFEQAVLRYVVKERPTISKILFAGNSEVETDDLKEVLKVKTYNLYDENLVRESANKLVKFYEDKGFYLAKVTYEVRPNKEKDEVELLFRIKEYDKVRIKQISFLGNTVFTDSELRRVMRNTGELSFFSWLSSSGNFKELDFKNDMQVLQYWYLNEGYVRFQADPPIVTVSEDKKWVYITIRVTEGKRYKQNEIDFSGDLLFPKEELHQVTTLKQGEWFAILKRNQDVLALTEKYQDLGYANVNVIPNMDIDDEALTVDTNYEIDKGGLVRFGRILLKGNTKTRDKVVRRELKIKEGELYSGTGMRLSKENVERLGFFEKDSVEFVTSSPPGRPDMMDVEINLKERPTGQFQLGAGYGTASKFFFTTQVAETNFRGMGQDLRFTAQLSADKRTRSFTLGFTDPYAFDSRWSAGGDIFYTVSPYPGRFLQYRRGLNLRVGYPLGDYTRLFLGYKFERFIHDEITDPFILRDRAREDGESSSVTATIVTDKRNNRAEPSKGYYLSLSEEFAGIGGNRKFVRSILDARFYHTLVGKLVLRTKFEAGNIWGYDRKPVQSAERFYLGGPNSLKGYDSFAVGPYRTTTNPLRNNELTRINGGGENQLLYIFELEHPIVSEVGLKFVVFYDVGEAFNTSTPDTFNLHQDFGWGIRWFSPLGPLRFEWGYPINPPPGFEKGPVFQFMIGPPF